MNDVLDDDELWLALSKWNSTRRLYSLPIHFVVCSHPLQDGAHEWIVEKLKGRYALVPCVNNSIGLTLAAFEDHEEAVLYELTWG